MYQVTCIIRRYVLLVADSLSLKFVFFVLRCAVQLLNVELVEFSHNKMTSKSRPGSQGTKRYYKVLDKKTRSVRKTYRPFKCKLECRLLSL